jgi:hypothetical protein
MTAIAPDLLSVAAAARGGAEIAGLVTAALILSLILRSLAVAAGPSQRPLARHLPVVILPLLLTAAIAAVSRLAAQY